MVKVAVWNPANPEERRYHVGKMAEFIQKGTPDNIEDENGNEEIPEGFWSWLRRTARDELNKPIGANRKEGRLK
jgi:hypothetical protein